MHGVEARLLRSIQSADPLQQILSMDGIRDTSAQVERHTPAGVELDLSVFVAGEGRQWPEVALRIAREAMVGLREKNALRQRRRLLWVRRTLGRDGPGFRQRGVEREPRGNHGTTGGRYGICVELQGSVGFRIVIVLGFIVLPPLPPIPPAAPQKAPSTAFEVELKTAELIKTAQQQRAQRNKIKSVRRNPRRPDEDADSDTNEQDGRSSRTTVDFLA